MKLTVLDLVPKQPTTATLQKAGLPFEEAANAAALTEVKGGIVIVGEGTSYKEEAELSDLLMKLARRGVQVLCLTPSEGALPWPEVKIGGKDGPVPASVHLRRFDFLTALDKRLDLNAWPTSTFRVKSDDDRLVIEAIGSGHGWPFVELDFTDTRGKLLACGTPLINHWDRGPASRYLLLRLLERVGREKS